LIVSEADEQREIIEWFTARWPEYRRSIRVSLAGINFGSGARAGRMVNHVRSQGICKGESDILIALPRGPYGSLVIEHKKGDAMRGATGEQLEYLQYHNAVGNCAVCTQGVDMAKAAINQYMDLLYEQ
jgi:hypothetical protein